MACLVVSSTGMRAQLLAGLLAQCAPVTIAAACHSAEAAIAAIDRDQPRLVILDRDGETDDCERIARHLLLIPARPRLILLSSDPRLEPLRRDLGPVIDRTGSWQALLSCVRARDQESREHADQVDPLPDVSCFEQLRPRERSVLELMGSGLGSREIARMLGVRVQTVETYRKSVSAKLGVSGARLVRIAVLYCCVYLGRLRSPSKGLDGDGHGLPAALIDLRDPNPLDVDDSSPRP